MKAWTSITRVALGLLALGVSASAMLYYARHEAASIPEILPRAEFVHAPGILVPAREIKILATGESRVVRIEVEPGQVVLRGQPLAVIESDTQREAVPAPASQLERELADARAALQARDSRLRTEEAALAIARAEFALSEERWRKAIELNESGLIARIEFENEGSTFEKAKAALDEAVDVVRTVTETREQTAEIVSEIEGRRAMQPRRDRAGEMRESRTLRSPVDGIVGEVLVGPGEFFPAPQEGAMPPVVMTVLDASRLNARVLAPASELGEIITGAGVGVEFAAEPLDLARGRVISAGEESAGIRELLIELDGWRAEWRAGQICTVSFSSSSAVGPIGEFVPTPDAAE